MDKRHIKQVVAVVLIGIGGFWLQWLATGCSQHDNYLKTPEIEPVDGKEAELIAYLERCIGTEATYNKVPQCLRNAIGLRLAKQTN